MKLSLSDGRWSPYIAGALVGILAVLTVIATSLILNKTHYLGASTTFVRVAGLTEQALLPGHVNENQYYTKTKIKVDWQMMVVLGIFLGAFASSRLGRSARLETVPPIWRERFGDSAMLRAVAAFGGGAILLFGARLADGCPSGHGLSGNMQLAVSGLLALVFFIVAGVITAKFVYGKRR
jgi:uncharacterized membrane protein YedE/YeeE